MSRKKWVISSCDKDLASEIAESCGVDPFAAYLLCARGMTDEFQIESFLYDTDLTDPYTLPDMALAVERIHTALENNEHITVFGDYDADGVTSTALLYLYLTSKGAWVDYYIPDRVGEGYGMNLGAVDILKDRGTNLIVTVDNGISAVEEIEYARSLGIDVVVTDHHRAGDILPNAVAVVDPHREDSQCEFSDWAGVGVTFKLISAVDGNEGYGLLEEYGDIITVGTIADIVPLKGENRIIVRSGIAFINDALQEGNLRCGLKALLDASNMTADTVDSNSIAFRISPRINAAGRMGSAERALKLLITKDEAEAKSLAEEISNDNASRQETETKISESAINLIESTPHIKNKRVIVVSGEGWQQGVIGIVASRLVDKYGKPCIVISVKDGVAKGSGRSIEGFSLYNALSFCEDVLEQYGGHTLAAGMSIKKENIDLFREKINEYAEKTETVLPALNIDCKLNPANMSLDILSSISLLEPFGAENPQPIFALCNMEITNLQWVGAGGKHIRITSRRKGISISAIMFSASQETFPYKVGDVVDMAVKLGANEYNGKTQLNIQIKDIKFSNMNTEAVLKSVNVYNEFLSDGNIPSEQKENIFVDRDFCVDVYRFIRANNGWSYSPETMAYRMNLPEEKTGACKIALDVFTELGLLDNKGDIYTLPKESKKADLENSNIFKKANNLQGLNIK
ncbi:MAG: single-stranded-DNA-specific exonuclease RecJ [Acutalibacteraceae bacterium]